MSDADAYHLSRLRQNWVEKKVVAYSREAFGSEEGKFAYIHSLSNEWVELELLDRNSKPIGDIYLIPSVHIILKGHSETGTS